ncbi:hypothetical protein Q7C36_015212 [Tachysurus vachellii]|uniref:Inhibitory synaptic factor 1 n=1 Tax=Tachysurus vachellii TaxID=175792 RepID=A0AA88SK41_TACVA|nr:inhibitory synaptic factor 1 [Tachysurus vachellii]KAK2834511.1 hypothetical protein Q7C36_015212 [Tachysurus vachellii]
MFHRELLGSLGITESVDRRKCICRHIRMVMEQLEDILNELKDVARELREVVGQIDNLTAYIDVDAEEDTEDDKFILTCSENSNERALGNFLKVEPYSESNGLPHLLHNCDSAKLQVPVLYRRSCGDLPALNGPTWPNASWLFRRRDEVHSYDSVEHHALCCDDDEFDEESGGRRSSRFSSSDSVFSSSPLRPSRLGSALTPRSGRKYQLSPVSKKKSLQSCSTQTVCDKSTQTALPHSPARQRAASERI